MKLDQRIYLALVFILFHVASYAQIGINTENPLGIFHIDGQRNTTSAGANVSDDVIVSAAGRIGLGMVPGNTGKVQIETNSTTTSAIRLVDGAQGAGKVLVAKDNNGNMGWVAPPIGWANTFYLTGVKNFIDKSATSFFETTVPYTGEYLVVLRWWGTADIASLEGRIISAYFNLNERNGASTSGKDAIEYYLPFWVSGRPFTFTVFLRGSFVAGRTIQLTITPATPMGIRYNWKIGASGTNRSYNPSVLVFKM